MKGSAEMTRNVEAPVAQAEARAVTNKAPRITSGAWISLAEKYGLVALLAILIVLFTIVSEHFLTVSNLQAIFGYRSVLCLLALATIVPLAAGHLDFSVGASMGVASIVSATAMSRFGLHPIIAILLAIAVGVLIGVINGSIIAKIAPNSLIVTLGTSTIMLGLVQFYTNGNAITTGISRGFMDAASGTWTGIPRGIFWLIPVALLMWYLMEHTPFGRYIASLGSNASAARLVGLPVDRLVIASFVVSAVTASCAGVLLVAQTGVGDPQTAHGALMLPAYAAAFLGCSAFRPGRFNVAGTLLAVYLVAFTVSGLVFAGASNWVEPVFNGLTLVAAVSISTYLAKRRAAGAIP